MELFLSDLRYKLKFNQKGIYNEFENIFENILNQHTPIKTKFVRANSKPHITNSLRKAIMKLSRLKNMANKSNCSDDMDRFQRQRNIVVNSTRPPKGFSSTKLNQHRVYQNLFGNFVNLCFPTM